ncbi:MAG: LytTR family transcriptional regulator DNA-binding domain-containing protein [Lachnospiraceae bacterium]|jgi:DNA-binding LytR/AlgR family response regulator|nr:LytTR family transcriptional regulator DNA-binding domain-containing protein [Lachnospiraceae bacterium]
MKDMVEIEVVLDEHYADPLVTIRTKSNTQQVENIICAIENASHSDFPQIAAVKDDAVTFVSQRDIVRVHTEGRKTVIQTEENVFTVKRTLAGLEDVLNPTRFLRISQSEIINLYKVKSFDFNLAGTIGVEFDCGIKSWASRSRVKQIKMLLKQNSIKGVD